MPDFGPSAQAKDKASELVKSSKSGPAAESSSDAKKRFEVKKVRSIIFDLIVTGDKVADWQFSGTQ